MRVKTEQRRTAILEAAAHVFLEVGYDRASIAAIAERVGGSKSTLYGYFQSKAELLMGVILHRYGGLISPALDELANKAALHPSAVLAELGVSWVSTITTTDAIAFKRLIIATMTKREEANRLWELGNQHALNCVEGYLIQAEQQGWFTLRHPAIAAQYLLGLFEAEVTWRAPSWIEQTYSHREILAIAVRATEVFIAAYGTARARSEAN